jgi:hypothetical protein
VFREVGLEFTCEVLGLLLAPRVTLKLFELFRILFGAFLSKLLGALLLEAPRFGFMLFTTGRLVDGLLATELFNLFPDCVALIFLLGIVFLPTSFATFLCPLWKAVSFLLADCLYCELTPLPLGEYVRPMVA